jgi:hypothetical protein
MTMFTGPGVMDIVSEKIHIAISCEVIIKKVMVVMFRVLKEAKDESG